MPYIKKEVIDKVWDAANIVDVIGQYVNLKKSGANYQALSPFKKESTPSFMVSPVKGIWKCFATGKGGNSAVSFLQEYEKMSYIEAIEALAKKYTIEIEYENSEQAKIQQKNEEERQELYPLMHAVIKKYHEEFLKLPEDHPAKIEVYQKRQYSKQTVEDYLIGYAPGKRFIYDLCLNNGKRTDALELGLISNQNDKWVDRVIYPLYHKRGSSLLPIGLAGRRLNDNSKYAKWLNSSESRIYKKETYWYGLDRARYAIAKSGEAFLVEGYNDVISLQINGLLNVIAGCGTSIALPQLKVLKKITSKIVLCLDPDSAGKKAMLKYIPMFLENGFRVQILNLGMDPDDHYRDCMYYYYDDQTGLKQKQLHHDFLASFSVDYREDGFKYLLDDMFSNGDAVDAAKHARELVSLINKIEDEAMQDIYKNWLVKESGVKLTTIKQWIKAEAELEEEQKKKENKPTEDFQLYILPDEVSEPLEKLLPTIEKYQMFQSNEKIYCQRGESAPYFFKSVSNFSIEIIQHMRDEKLPMKLVRIKNVHNHEAVFDIESSAMNTPMAFENAVTAHGNYRWKGDRKDHELLKTFLFDNMGTGRKVDVLGWQPEGFWCWNNKVVDPTGETIKPDENGCFMFNKTAYYMPSANSIYANNPYKFEAQKKVVSISPEFTFQNLFDQSIKVHREHGMVGILFSIASMFQDLVVNYTNGGFPMLFLYGPASSGKDQLADLCQSFFGQPQSAINLEGGISTAKAQVREFAQFCNLISQLSEYKPGDPKLDGMLKGLWDRNGYKRGNIDSHVGTESIPILSSVIMTGNYAPDQEALITRYIWCIMDKTAFTKSEDKEYEKLSDMVKKGFSGFTDEIIQHRDMVKNNFKYKYREFYNTLKQRHPDAVGRIIQNLAVIGTFYQLFQNILNFTFSHEAMLDHFSNIIEKTSNKLSSASIINKFWDCFLASLRGSMVDQIQLGRDIKLDGDKLYFNFTSCYNRVSRQWISQYREVAPGKSTMMDKLKKDNSFIDQLKSTRMGQGVSSKSTSAYLIDVSKLPLHEEIIHAIDFQKHKNSIFGGAETPNEENGEKSPVTPDKNKE